ncbi:MAG: diaminopropionate ammonia-lyase [Gammaproteobacteria bacterium]|jgi:diaminopropionate ammonia-lyase
MPDTGLNVDHRPVMNLLKQCPLYAPTPLQTIDALSRELGIESLRIKNESPRMGLGSFKALGGSYAILQLILRQAGHDQSIPVDLADQKFREAAASKVFVCATAGNHGLSVAAGATLFGAKSVVYIAESVPESFAQRLKDKGAEVVRQGAVYEQAMQAALAASERNGWQLIADTSWSDYLEIPRLIYQGYTVIAEECRQQFEASNNWPDHIFLQAGVGGMAAALAAHCRQWWAVQPKIFVVEPTAAPCLARSVSAGKMVDVEGQVSNMGRLDCKRASLLTFESLRHTADGFIEVSESEAETSTTMLDRYGILSTPSGSAGLAGLAHAVSQGQIAANANCLVVVSEGA